MFLLMYNLIDICQKHNVKNFTELPHILKVVPIHFLNAKIFVERSDSAIIRKCLYDVITSTAGSAC